MSNKNKSASIAAQIIKDFNIKTTDEINKSKGFINMLKGLGCSGEIELFFRGLEMFVVFNGTIIIIKKSGEAYQVQMIGTSHKMELTK